MNFHANIFSVFKSQTNACVKQADYVVKIAQMKIWKQS